MAGEGRGAGPIGRRAFPPGVPDRGTIPQRRLPCLSCLPTASPAFRDALPMAQVRVACTVIRSTAILVVLGVCAAVAPADDGAVPLERAPVGTPFVFEVVESIDASYLGDTPSHVGRSGGLEHRPNVALGDPVYRVTGRGEERRSVRVGRISRVVWERVSGSLTVEVDPDPLVRIAVGDEVWIDLNPAPADAPAAGSAP